MRAREGGSSFLSRHDPKPATERRWRARDVFEALRGASEGAFGPAGPRTTIPQNPRFSIDPQRPSRGPWACTWVHRTTAGHAAIVRVLGLCWRIGPLEPPEALRTDNGASGPYRRLRACENGQGWDPIRPRSNPNEAPPRGSGRGTSSTHPSRIPTRLRVEPAAGELSAPTLQTKGFEKTGLGAEFFHP